MEIWNCLYCEFSSLKKDTELKRQKKTVFKCLSTKAWFASKLRCRKGWALAKKKKISKSLFQSLSKNCCPFHYIFRGRVLLCVPANPDSHFCITIVHVALPWAAWLPLQTIKGNFQTPEGKNILKNQDKTIRCTNTAPVTQGSWKCFKDTNYLKFVMARDYRLVHHIKIKYMY